MRGRWRIRAGVDDATADTLDRLAHVRIADASIALIAQIGFRPAHLRITSQSRHVATNTFKARCTPARLAAIRRRGGPIGKTTRAYSWAVGGLPLRR